MICYWLKHGKTVFYGNVIFFHIFICLIIKWIGKLFVSTIIDLYINIVYKYNLLRTIFDLPIQLLDSRGVPTVTWAKIVFILDAYVWKKIMSLLEKKRIVTALDLNFALTRSDNRYYSARAHTFLSDHLT